MINKKKKVIALSVVALVLASLVVFGLTTYAWIDDVKLVEFNNDDLANNSAPLKTGTDINSTVNITKDNNTVDLGNMLENSDITYTDNDHAHIKYDTSSPNNTKNPDMDEINEKKGYFYESGDMHLSGCYSDGETFFFPRQGEGASGYREGNKDDENVNYISFTTKVSSPDANVDFWFKNEPAVYISGTKTKITKERYAIIIDGKCHIYSNDGNANTISNDSVSSINSITRKASAYTYGHTDNNTEDRGKNSNVLFSIKKGDTVNMTIKIWLESGFDATITASDINVQLVSSWAYTRTIKIIDKTTTNTKKSWLNDDKAKLYFTCPAVLNEYAKEIYNNPDVSKWKNIPTTDGYEHAPFFYLNDVHSTEDGYDIYTITIPMVYIGDEMIIYRCSSAGWNNGDHSGKTGDYGVHYWNWWESTIPSTYGTGIYTLYGGSHDEYAGSVVTDDTKKKTYLGYGTWGTTEQITVYQNYHNVDWAKCNNNSDNIYIRDYSDFDTSGETYVHSMYWNSSDSTWTATIPKSSALLQFLFTQNSVIKGCYGYHSFNNYDGNNHFNPQMRPENSTSYHLTYKNDKDGNVNGLGYWSGANRAYLIANGSYHGQSSFNSYLFYKYKWWDNNNASDVTWKNDDSPGTSMSEISGVNYQGTYKVYQTDVISNSNGKDMYPDRSKSNDGNNANKITQDTTVIFSYGTGSSQTSELRLFPGCYYDYDNGVWLGSLTGTARSGNITGEDTSGDDPGTNPGGGGTIEGYTIESDFTVQLGGHTYTVYQNSDGTSFKVILPLASGDNWTTFQKSGINYGLQASGQHYSIPENGSLNINIFREVSNNISLRATSAGNYLVTFAYENGNTGTVNISSAEKQS